MVEGRLSLQARLMLLLVAAMLPLAALSVWLALRDVESVAQLVQSQLKLTASAVAAGHDRSVEAAQQLLGAISAQPQLSQLEPEACVKYLAKVRDSFPIYANLGLISPQGRLLCLARGPFAGIDTSDRLYFRQALAGGGFAMGEAVMGRSLGSFMLGFALPLTVDGKVVAVAFAALDLAQASAALSSIDLPPGARVHIVDRRGLVLMEYPLRKNLPLGRTMAETQVLDAARQMEARAGESVDGQGQGRIFAAAPTRAVGDQRLLAVVSLQRDQVTQASAARLVNVLAAASSTMFMGLLAAWWLGRRMIVKPARQILGGVRRLEAGSLDARVPLRRGDRGSEFGRIAAAFNLMAESLQLRQRDLQAELERGRGAYAVLDLVLNSMQDALIAVNLMGLFLMHNQAATRLFPLQGAPLLPKQWARHFGLYHADGVTLFEPDEVPMARAIRGESGRQLQMVVRNSMVPQGRLLLCSFQPMRGEGGINGGLVVFADVTEHRKAQADLVLLRKAVARLNDVVLITQADPLAASGPVIVFVNEAFERLTGYTAQEALGQSPRMLQGPQTDRDALGRIRAALARYQPVREELVNYAKDGRAYVVEIDIVPLTDEAGRHTHFVSVERDITSRKEAERALLSSQGELLAFTLMLQRMAEAVQAIAAGRTLAGTLQAVVDEARETVGAHQALLSHVAGDSQSSPTASAFSVSEPYAAYRETGLPLAGSDWYTRICQTQQPLRLTQEQLQSDPNWRGLAALIPTPAPGGGLLAVPLPDPEGGNVGMLLLAGKIDGDFNPRDEYVAMELAQMASIAIDKARLFEQIQELNAGLEARIAERTVELSRQEARFRALAEQAPQVVWNTDASGTRLTFVNRAWYDLIGGAPGKWIGKSGLSVVHPDDRVEVAANWLRSIRDQTPSSGVRRVRSKDGSYRTMSFRATPALDEQGQVAFWVGIDTDISELKAIEQALRDSNQELEAFSYSVSHDLRAPLGAIGGFSQALQSRLGPQADERALHYLERIQASVGKMEELIEALLLLAKVVRTPLQFGQIDLGAAARETLVTLHAQHPLRQVNMVVHNDLQANGDPRLLRLVIENLVGNAWKFTSAQERARIEVGKLENSGVFFVRDNGAGFDMAHAAKLFNPFQRLHSHAEFPGTGIGLATVRRIVGRHQGRVWVEAQEGQGATFFFTLSSVAPPAWLIGEAPAA